MGLEEWLDSAAYVQCVCYITFFYLKLLFSLSWSLSHLHTGEDRLHPWIE